MEKPDSTSGSGGSTVYNTVFIDTSLDTHLAMIVSDSDTVSDLKKKILYEHPLCFPKIGEIKINALKVKRKGYLYHLSDSMFVKSAFGGVSKSWFLSVDASSSEEHMENHNSCKPGTGITTNNSSADVVDLLPVGGGPSKILSNINDASLPQDGKNHHAKQNSASQQVGFSNCTQENQENLQMEVEHMADSNSKVLFPATSKESRPKVHQKNVGDNKICEDLPASVDASVLKEKHKIKKRNKDAIHCHDVKENGAFVVESGKDAFNSDNVIKENSFQNGICAVLNDMNLGNQIHVDENCRSLSSHRYKRSAMADEGSKVPGEHLECETNKHKDVSLSEQGYKSTENSSQYGPTSKKKRKVESKDGNENSLIENGVLISDFDKEGTGPDTTASKPSLGQKLESTSAALDHCNTESVKENRLLIANASCGRKKKKRQKSNPSQGGSEISSAKDVYVDAFQAIEAINHKDLGSEADAGLVLGKFSMDGAIPEHCLISLTEMQEDTNKVPHSEGDDGLADTSDGNMESQNEAPEPDVVSGIKTRDSIDQNACHVNRNPTLVSQEGTNLQNDIGVSGHENKSGTLEDKIVEPKTSSKKMKKSKKTKDLVGGKEAVDQIHDRGPASDLFPAERPASVSGVHLSDNPEQDGTTDGKEESQMKTSDSLPAVTDVRADDVIRDVPKSLQQCNNRPANVENMDKKSRKKTKKKSSTVVDTPKLGGKGDVDHRDPIILADNMSDVSASCKSSRKTVNVNLSSTAELNESNLGSKNTGVGFSPVRTQLGSSQNTLKTNHDGRSIQDVVNVDHPKSTCVDHANNSIEVHSESERIKSQRQHEIVDSGEMPIDKVTEKRGVETEVKGKKKKRKREVQSGGSRADLPSSQMLIGNQHKEAKAQAAKSSSILSPRSSLKVEPYSSSVQSSKTHLSISESAVRESLQTNKSDKTNSIPKGAQKLIDINSSRAHTHLEKNNASAVSSSTVERSKITTNLNKGGNERRSHLEIAKSTRSNHGEVVNSLANNKSLLSTMGTIFKHDDKESSDDEDGVDNSDASTRTPSDSSSSSDSGVNVSSSQNGSYNSEGKEGGGRNRRKPGSSSPKSMSLHAILRNSSSYKKAKLTASQDLDTQTDEFVPDGQAT
ncbi:uncharacterized protein LOC111317947 isoform X2 [Durio zibethinus]|uniref:Uncharacterized protein LOC111317947 isoform X2 n=1 Tax=Durio zibethinus TaxID=66656 RepID=A0A6P6BGJ7_DURZI|nr:uncharacterized protein LOC111317947 isoform X2 [Durio zibethinus]